MNHAAGESDRAFRSLFEAGRIAPADFDHRAHVRLAYVLLVAETTEAAYVAMRGALNAFLAHHGIAAEKYHDTLTRAWILAVRHFMEKTPGCRSADEFIARNGALLDPKIMLTHYSADVLFSSEARASFIPPDVASIPTYAAPTTGISQLSARRAEPQRKP